MKTTILLLPLFVAMQMCAVNGAIWNCGWADKDTLLKNYSMGFNAGSKTNANTACVGTLD